MPQAADMQAEVLAELVSVRGAGLTELDQYDENQQHKVPAVWLDEAAKKVHGYSSDLSRSTAIWLLLRQEIELITVDPCRDWLPFLYGLTEESSRLHPDDRRKKAAKLAGFVTTPDYVSFKRSDGGTERKALKLLAAQIIAHCLSLPDNSPGETPQIDPYVSAPIVPREDSFIERPAYTSDFVVRLERGDKVIPFVGEPGNGKTRLADWLIGQHRTPQQSRVDIRAHDLALLHSDVRGYLARIGDHVTGLDSEPLLRRFAEHICTSDAPDYLFIDNLGVSLDFDVLVPRAVQSTVVVTSREAVVPRERAQPLVVQAMEPGEAVDLVRLFLPTMSHQDIYRLLKRLARRPLAIEHVCAGLLVDEIMTVNEFCAEFDRDAGAIDDGAPSLERQFTFIYGQIIQQLRQVDARNNTYMVPLLELIAFVAPEAIPTGLLLGSFLSLGIPEVALSKAKFQAAQRELRTRYLIDRRDEEFSIHPFTQSILRSVLSQEGAQVRICLHLHQWVQAAVRDEPLAETMEGCSPEVIRLLQHILSIASGLGGLEDEQHEQMNFGHTMAVLYRGFSFIADKQGLTMTDASYPQFAYMRELGNLRYMYEAYIERIRSFYQYRLMSTDAVLLTLSVATQIAPSPPWSAILAQTDAMVEIQPAKAIEFLDNLALLDPRIQEVELNDKLEARRLLLLGKANHLLGNWEEAEKNLFAARDLLVVRVDNRETWLQREVMTVYRLLLDNAYMGFRPTLVKPLTDDLNAYISSFNDGLDIGFVLYRTFIDARGYAATIVMLRFQQLAGLIERDDELLSSYLENFLQMAQYVVRYNRSFSVQRDWTDILYDVLALAGTMGYTALAGKVYADIEEDADEIYRLSLGEQGDAPSRLSYMKLFIGRAKGLDIWFKFDNMERYLDIARQCESYAQSLKHFERFYWYAEALAMAVVYYARVGDKKPVLLDQVANAYNNIHRLDRWFALKSTIAKVPEDVISGNFGDFFDRFMYLVRY